jgi:hypothetical protein
MGAKLPSWGEKGPSFENLLVEGKILPSESLSIASTLGT